MAGFTHRIASLEDLEALRAVMRRSIETLQDEFLTPQQVRASHQVMGLDSQLVRDGTYFVIESGGNIAGCGGWSWRSTLYGGDDSLVSREPSALDPATEAAIMETIKELMRGRTTLIATHRLATIHNLDQIIVLDHGRMIEQGRGPDLLTRGGIYAKLYASGKFPT